MKQPEIKGISLTDILLIASLIASILALYFVAQSRITKLERQLQQSQPVIQQENSR